MPEKLVILLLIPLPDHAFPCFSIPPGLVGNSRECNTFTSSTSSIVLASNSDEASDHRKCIAESRAISAIYRSDGGGLAVLYAYDLDVWIFPGTVIFARYEVETLSKELSESGFLEFGKDVVEWDSSS